MSESKSTSSPALNRRTAAIIGLAVVFAIILIINFLAGKVSLRADLTEYQVFTLSEGTENILAALETPVEVRFYVTDDSKVMSPSERASARRVEDLLNEFVKAAPTKDVEIANAEGEFETKRVKMLSVKKFNPEPNTDAEDAADLDGLQIGSSGETGNALYFGLAVQSLDEVETIPFIPARPETLLEYDLARAVSTVHSGRDKRITIMSSMPIGGGFGGNFQAPPQQPWIIYEQLIRDYEVEVIPASATEIPEGTSALIVLHPYDITDVGQFAIDQYLLGGGNVLAFVDPNFFYARAMAQQQPQMPGMPPQGGPAPTSDLDKLFKSWGVSYDSNRVLADLQFGSEIMRRGNFSPTFLTLERQSLGSEPTDPGFNDPLTSMLNQLNMLTPGAFEISPPEGIEVDRLVLTSEVNQLVGSFDADPTQEGGADRIQKDFKPYGKRRVLVARLSGEFKTAFPEGDPSLASEEEDETEGEKTVEGDEDTSEQSPDALQKSTAPAQVVLIADVDFIFDANVVRRTQLAPNLVIPELLNENLTLSQNAAEQLAGDPNLIKVRSRTSVRRPFTKPNEWQREAQEKYAEEVANFNAKASEVEARLAAILAQTPENIDQALLSPEVQDELRKLEEQRVQFNIRGRELEKEVTKEFRRKLATFKFGNALIMPAIVILFGIGLAIARRKRVAAR